MKKLILTILLAFAAILPASAANITADEVVGTTVITWSNGSAGLRGFFEASGTWGSGTLTLYRWVGTGSPNDASPVGEWVAFSGAALTDDGGTEFATGMRYLSISLSGSTSPDINWFVTPAKQ